MPTICMPRNFSDNIYFNCVITVTSTCMPRKLSDFYFNCLITATCMPRNQNTTLTTRNSLVIFRVSIKYGISITGNWTVGANRRPLVIISITFRCIFIITFGWDVLTSEELQGSLPLLCPCL